MERIKRIFGKSSRHAANIEGDSRPQKLLNVELAHSELPKIIEVGPSLDFVYIMREDTQFTMSPLAKKFSQDNNFDYRATREVFDNSYSQFRDGLANVFVDTLSNKGNVEMHLFAADQLDTRVRELAGNLPIISMDPLMHEGTITLPVSRGYYLSGIHDFGPVARPGYDSLDDELTKISAFLEGQSVCLVEDDIYSGGTVVGMIKKLKAHGIQVKNVVTGIQIGAAKEILDMGVNIVPAVKYQDENGDSCPQKIDLGDPRDFLIGASGLVVKLPSGNYGRVPYILPFVSSSERCSISPDKDVVFAKKVFDLNKKFFSEIEKVTGEKLLLRHMDPHFVDSMKELYGMDGNVSMEVAITWLEDNMSAIWEAMKKLGKKMEEESGK